MFDNISIWTAVFFVVVGLAVLAWSSDKFVLGAAALAKWLGVTPFVVGMVIVGFGTSAPELLVSTFSGLSGHTDLSLGNAYGSCVFNVAAILGIAALINPLEVKKSILTIASPLLLAIVAIAFILLKDGVLSRIDSLILLAIFALVMPLYCKFDKPESDSECDENKSEKRLSLGRAIFWTLFSLAAMVVSSQILVSGSVKIASFFFSGKNGDLIIGLTVVAIGTSLPELASAIAASRRNQSELVLGNIVGSNIFNMLAVIGIAGAISPAASYSRFVLLRDLPALAIVTALIPFLALAGKKKENSSSRIIGKSGGAIFIMSFAIYLVLMLIQEVSK